MMHPANCWNTTEKGAAALLVALSLLVLMGIAAIAIDGGMAYDERRSTQNVADNTALAAASADCRGLSDPIAQARQVHLANGYAIDEVEITPVIPTDLDAEYHVLITSERETTFGRTLGAEEMTVLSEATAGCNQNFGAGAAAMFAKGPSCTLVKGGTGDVTGDVYSAGNMTWNGGGSQTIDGSMHSDANLTVNGGPPDITGQATATGTGTPSSFVSFGPAKNLPYPVSFEIDDFRPPSSFGPGIQYHNHGIGDIRASDINALGPGIHFVDGNVTNQGQPLNVSPVTIVATGTITLNNADFTAYYEGLAMMAGAESPPTCSDVIDIGGSGTINGILFAPNGQLSVHGGAVNGGMIAWSINTAGNLKVAVDLDLFPEGDPEILLLE